MDRIQVCGTCDVGSIPAGSTKTKFLWGGSATAPSRGRRIFQQKNIRDRQNNKDPNWGLCYLLFFPCEERFLPLPPTKNRLFGFLGTRKIGFVFADDLGSLPLFPPIFFPWPGEERRPNNPQNKISNEGEERAQNQQLYEKPDAHNPSPSSTTVLRVLPTSPPINKLIHLYFFPGRKSAE